MDGRTQHIRRTDSAPSYARYLRDGDTNPRTAISDGKIEFGAGGTKAFDVNIYRGAADRLQSDDEIRSTRGECACVYCSDQGRGRCTTPE